MNIVIYNEAGKPAPGKPVEVPEHLIAALSPWARVECRQFDFGTILTQTYSCRQFHIYLYRFDIQRPTCVSAICDKNLSALQATLTGKIPGTIRGPMEVLLTSDTFSMIYLPEGEHHVRFDAEVIESLHFEFDDNYIIDLTEGWPRQQELLGLISQASKKGFLFPRVCSNHKAQTLINNIRYCNNTGPTLPLQLKTYISQWLALYLDSIIEKEYMDALPDVPHRTILIDIAATIKAGPNQRLHTLDHFSKKYYLHAKTISRYFKQLFGISFIDFVRQQSLEKSRNLINSTYRDISDIAEETGYSDIVSFNKAFKKRFGVSPKSLRK